MAMEKLWREQYVGRRRVFSHCYLLLAIMLSWLLYAITDLSDIGMYLSRLFPFAGGEALFVSDVLRFLPRFGPLLAVGIFASTSPFARTWDRLRSKPVASIILLVLFWLTVYCLSAGLNDPFLYFSF